MLIARYEEQHVAQVRAFNERLRAGGSLFQFGTAPAKSANAFVGTANEIRSEHFLALDDGNAVRGAYTLIFQRFLIGGAAEQVAFLQIPISEGTVNSAFGAVGLLLLKDALRRSPLLFGSGGGGIDRPLPKLYRVLGGSVCDVPFFFKSCGRGPSSGMRRPCAAARVSGQLARSLPRPGQATLRLA